MSDKEENLTVEIVPQRGFGDARVNQAVEVLKQQTTQLAEHLERVVCEAIEKAFPMGATGIDANLREAVRTSVGRTKMLDESVGYKLQRLETLVERLQTAVNLLDAPNVEARLEKKRETVKKQAKKYAKGKAK